MMDHHLSQFWRGDWVLEEGEGGEEVMGLDGIHSSLLLLLPLRESEQEREREWKEEDQERRY